MIFRNWANTCKGDRLPLKNENLAESCPLLDSTFWQTLIYIYIHIYVSCHTIYIHHILFTGLFHDLERSCLCAGTGEGALRTGCPVLGFAGASGCSATRRAVLRCSVERVERLVVKAV